MMSPINGRRAGLAVAGVLGTLAGLGCAAGPRVAQTGTPFVTRAQSECDGTECIGTDCIGRECDGCDSADCVHGNHDGPRRWSEEWYAMRAGDPVGERQRCRHGKLWPPFPRPAGRTQQLTHRFHATHYWPYPYVCHDRAYTRSIMATQIGNGWMEETTLYAHHFDADTHELNFAGRNHLRWILQEVPEGRRAAFVQRSDLETVSQQRLASVQATAAEMAGPDGCPPVVLRTAIPEGTPAEYVDSIQRAIRDTIPEPRIQYVPNPVGGAGGG